MKRCPWCGHDRQCTPGQPARQSMHHGLCCVDQYIPDCRGDDTEERAALTRIMREDEEDRRSA